MDIYHHSKVFERILSLYESPTLAASAKKKILNVIYRSTQVGGSSVLITRAGIISWIQSQVVLNLKDVSTVTALMYAAYDSSDRGRVDTWSGGALLPTIGEIGIEAA